MTSFVKISPGDYLYVRMPGANKDRRVTVTDIRDDNIISGALYDRSLKEYVERVIDISWITGIRIISSRGAATVTLILLCELN